MSIEHHTMDLSGNAVFFKIEIRDTLEEIAKLEEKAKLRFAEGGKLTEQHGL